MTHGLSVSESPRGIYRLLAALFLFRLMLAAWLPLELSVDEAYYWDWSRIPALGYYSKPPMIAWLNWLSRSLFPAHAFFLRLPAVCLGTGSLLLFYLLLKELCSERVAHRGLLLAAVMPGQAALSLFMTTDSLLVFCWCAALLLLWKALQRGSYWYWMGCGLCVGLGILSKQMMLLFGPLMLSFLFLSAPHRPVLRSPGPWLLLLMGYGCFLLPLSWNARHDWITFQHSSEHFGGQGLSQWLKDLPEFFGGQLYVLSPVTALGVAWLCLKLSRNFRRLQGEALFLFVMGPALLWGFLLLSCVQRVNANWPAVFSLGGVALFAWATEEGFPPLKQPLGSKWFRGGLLGGLILSGMLYLMIMLMPLLPLAGSRLDPTRRLAGWKELAVQLQQLRDELGGEELLLMTHSRALTATLSFYLEDQPRVYKWRAASQPVKSQYEIWGGPEDAEGRNMLLLERGDREIPPEWFKMFAEVKHVGELHTERGKHKKYQVYLGIGLKDWMGH